MNNFCREGLVFFKVSSTTMKIPKKEATPSPVAQMPSGQGKSMAPPQTALAASNASPRQPVPYTPHPNDPKSGSPLGFMTEYGVRQEGAVANRGKGDADAFSPNDVNQSGLGNCYLLAALMALADTRPDVLRNAITGPLPDGTYNVRIFTGSGDDPSVPLVPKVVNVSAHFLTNKHEAEFGGEMIPVGDPGRATYAYGGDNDAEGNEEFWVKLLEKVFAKEAGDYANGLDGGFSAHVLEALTGEQAQELWFNGVHATTERDKQHLVSRPMSEVDLSVFTMRSLRAGYPTAASTYETEMLPHNDPAAVEEMERFRIRPLHAYGVLHADVNRITLSNPHGEEAGDAAQIALTWRQFKRYFKELSSSAVHGRR
jgi:hypothetical protein